MPKHLVTALGLVIALGVIALGVFLVAMPLYFQAVGVDTETATVANTNAIYQTQVDHLQEQEENLDAINTEVDQLRSQIPATGQLDDVFEVVARAAEDSGVALTTVTAGEQVGFVARTGSTEGEAAAPAPEPTPTEGAGETDAADESTADVDESVTATNAGRQQVDFVIRADAADMVQATAFLDALRRGPRLLNNVAATATQSSEGVVDVQITAITYLDAER